MQTDLSREQLMSVANLINESYETEPLKVLRRHFKGLLIAQICLGISQLFLVVGAIVYEITSH